MRLRHACRAGIPVLALALIITAARPATLALVDVATYHNDNGRTGQNLNEITLTPANVNALTFGRIGFLAVDGKVDAQPLYLSAVPTSSFGTRNVLYVATEHNSVYAFDADSGATLWRQSMTPAGEATSDPRNCGQVTPEIGITATPVIDRTRGPNGAIYVVAMTKNATGAYIQRLHALDITTGAELFGGPQIVQASVPGTGVEGASGQVIFDAGQHEVRAALLLVNGTIVTAWSSHCDIAPYTGWVISYDASTLARRGVLNVTPNGREGAMWMAGGGPAADSSGQVYLLTGNGTFDTTLDGLGFPNRRNFGNAFVKLSTASGLAVTDYFSPFDTVSQSAADMDLGSGGVALLPDQVDALGVTRRLAVGTGKDRRLYVYNRDWLGRWDPSRNNVYQELTSSLVGPMFAVPAYFDHNVYFGPVSNGIKAFRLTAARLGATPASQTAQTFQYPGATPSISANGTGNAILWAVRNSSPAVLHAYDARDLTRELYNSNQAGTRDQFGPGNKFITPTIANGKVYVGTQTGVAVFGLFPAAPHPPANLAVSTSGMTATLSWSAATTGGAPTTYVLEAGSGPGLADIGSGETGSVATSITVPVTSVGTFYVRVRSRNSVGTSAPSNDGVIAMGVPGPPSNLTAFAWGSTVTLWWTAPTVGGAPTTYIIEAGRSPGSSDLGSAMTFSTATALTINGVGPGTYYIRVKAANLLGAGAASNETTIVR